MIDLNIDAKAIANAKKHAFALATRIVSEVVSRGGNAADLTVEERGSGYVVLANGSLGPRHEFGTVHQPELRLITLAINAIRAGGVA